MTLSDLPREIVNQIAELLYFQDQASCTLVCKAWRELFQDSVYSDLRINRRILDSIVNSTQDDQQPHQKNGYLVKRLDLKHDLYATGEEFYTLQKAFPNIKSIDLSPNALNPDNVGTMADWNLWGLLRELIYYFGDSIMSDLENILAKITKSLPHLRQLNIHYCSDHIYPIPVSLNTFEIIHSHANHLGYLELCLNLSVFSKTDVERIPEVLPATEMRILKISTRSIDYRWLYYFARKYSNLHTLEFDTKDTRDNDEESEDTKKQRTDTIELFRKAPLLFQHLTALDIRYSQCSDEECLFFWDLIDFHDIPLKTIRVDLQLNSGYNHRHHRICNVSKRIIAICLTNFSKTIESLSVRGTYEYIPAFDFVEIKDRLCNLVKLEIEIPTTGEIDTLLCAAPHLKSLSLEHSDIRVKNKLSNSSRFVLASFEVDSSKITSDVLRFLSFHCRSLNTLSLVDTEVRGNFTTLGCQLIDMSYTHLQLLSIIRMVFIIQDSRSSYDNWSIALITDKPDDIPPKQDTDPKAFPAVIRDTYKNPFRLWIYSDNEKDMYYISDSRGSSVERFVKNYERNKRITIEKGIHRGRGRRSDYWNNRCMFGYTKLKIGYIASFITEETIDYYYNC